MEYKDPDLEALALKPRSGRKIRRSLPTMAVAVRIVVEFK